MAKVPRGQAMTGFHAAVFTAALLTATAAHAQLFPPLFPGQWVSWKNFQPPGEPFTTPATYGAVWQYTGYPTNDKFHKAYDQTGIQCIGVVDVQPNDGLASVALGINGIGMDAADRELLMPGATQSAAERYGISAPLPRPGVTHNVTLGIVPFVYTKFKHGDYHIMLVAQSSTGAPVTFGGYFNIQCWEIVLPESQP